MWTRKELKQKGQKAFNRNYWKCVLAALILALVTGGSSGSFGGTHINSSSTDPSKTATGLAASGLVGVATGEASTTDVSVSTAEDEEDPDSINDLSINFHAPEWNNLSDDEKIETVARIAGIATIVFILGLVIFAVILVLDAFIFNPLELGGSRFFYKNLDENADVSELTFGFDHGYGNIVRIMFRRDIYVCLWSLLLIIPGIIKSYEYRMIPYLLAENPEMSREEVFATSKAMMDGQKWKAFVLDLSFIGWDILSLFTAGLLGIFFVSPYRQSTKAALYEALKIGSDNDITVTVSDAAEVIAE